MRGWGRTLIGRAALAVVFQVSARQEVEELRAKGHRGSVASSSEADGRERRQVIARIGESRDLQYGTVRYGTVGIPAQQHCVSGSGRKLTPTLEP